MDRVFSLIITLWSLRQEISKMSMIHTRIYLEVDCSQFVSAFKIGHQAYDIWLKLTKRNEKAVLAMTMIDQTKNSTPIHLSHDIPVTVIPAGDAMIYLAPSQGSSDIDLILPNLTKLKNILDRVHRNSHFLKLSGNQNGMVRVELNSTQMSVECTLKSLSPSLECHPDESNSWTSVTIDTRSFLKFLQCLTTAPIAIKASKFISSEP